MAFSSNILRYDTPYLKVRVLYPYFWKCFLEARHHNVLISQDQRILKILDIKEARRISEWFQTFWGTQGRGPGPYYTAHSGLVFIMSFLHINLDRGSSGFPD